MNDADFIAELLAHMKRAQADPAQLRRSVLGVVRALEKRFADLDIGCPEEIVRPPPQNVTVVPSTGSKDRQRRA